MRYDLVDLKLLVHIAEAKSLTRAAERCHLSVPSVSLRVRQLEENFGVRLMQRQARGVELTPAGRIVERRALRILRELACMHDELAPFSEGLYGEVRLMATTVAMATFVPEALAMFLREHPKVNVHVEEMNSTEILAATIGNRIDLGVVAHRCDDPAIAYAPLRRDDLIVMLPVDSPLAGMDRVAFEQLLHAHEFVGFGRLSAIDGFLNDVAAEMSKRRVTRIQVNSLDALTSMVAHHVGVAVIPRSLACRITQQPIVCVKPLSDEWASREISLCWPHGEERPGYVADMCSALIEAAAADSSRSG